MRAEEIDRGFAGFGDVEGVATGGGQRQHRPGGHFRPGLASGGGGEAATGALLGFEPTEGLGDRGRLRLRRGGREGEAGDQDQRCRDAAAAQGAGQRAVTTGRAWGAPPLPLEALAEADQHPHHRRAGDQRQHHVAEHVGDVERDRTRLQHEEVPP